MAGRKSQEYRKLCFYFHDNKCIICNVKEVTVHHLDENKNNNHPTNLIPLCEEHHRNMHDKFDNKIYQKVLKYARRFFKRFIKNMVIYKDNILKGNINLMFGKDFSKDHIKKLSKIGNKKQSEETKRKIGDVTKRRYLRKLAMKRKGL